MKNINKIIHRIFNSISVSLTIGTITMSSFVLPEVANAKAIAVTDYGPEAFAAECCVLADKKNTGIKISDAMHSPEFTNIPELDAWVSGVVKDDASFVMTLQTDKDNQQVMAIMFSIDLKESETNNPDADLQLAGDFIPIFTEVLGMTEEEQNKLFNVNFSETPTGNVWCNGSQRQIYYAVQRASKFPMVYFMLFADDEQKSEVLPLISETEKQEIAAGTYVNSDK